MKLPPLAHVIPTSAKYRCSCHPETQHIPFNKNPVCRFCGKDFTASTFTAAKNKRISENLKILVFVIIIVIAAQYIPQDWLPSFLK